VSVLKSATLHPLGPPSSLPSPPPRLLTLPVPGPPSCVLPALQLMLSVLHFTHPCQSTSYFLLFHPFFLYSLSFRLPSTVRFLTCSFACSLPPFLSLFMYSSLHSRFPRTFTFIRSFPFNSFLPF
jgi:hypothetical protein